MASLNTSNSLAGDRSVLVTSNGTVSGGVYVDYQFDDANGTAVKDTAVNNGTSAASWNFGVGTVQAEPTKRIITRSGARVPICNLLH